MMNNWKKMMTAGTGLLVCLGSMDAGLRAQDGSAPAQDQQADDTRVLVEAFKNLVTQKAQAQDPEAVAILERAKKNGGNFDITMEQLKGYVKKWSPKKLTPEQLVAEFQRVLTLKIKQGNPEAVAIYKQVVKDGGKLSLTEERMRQLLAKWQGGQSNAGRIGVNFVSRAEGDDVDYSATSKVSELMQSSLSADDKALTRDEVEAQREVLWKVYQEAAIKAGWDKQLLKTPETVDRMVAAGKPIGLTADHLRTDGKSMPYLFVAKGEKPAGGWPMFICLHGGGKYDGEKKIGAHGWAVNTSEWQAQMQLAIKAYKPSGLYFIPRMADDRMGRWWHKHNIEILTGMIRRAILFNDVDPNKIYIMGVSQGGYGTGHLAPFMADLFAAAGPMAGGMMTVTENLRNLPYRTDIGEMDTAYDRIKLARELHEKINKHKSADPKGYINELAIQKGRGHGIDYSKSPAWMSKFTRNPYPDRVAWRCHEKDGLYRDSFYWLSLTDKPNGGEFQIAATLDKKNNAVEIKGGQRAEASEDGKQGVRKPLKKSKVVVHLNDKMLDLDKEVIIRFNGKVVFRGKVKRSQRTMMRNLVERGDPNYVFPVDVTVGL